MCLLFGEAVGASGGRYRVYLYCMFPQWVGVGEKLGLPDIAIETRSVLSVVSEKLSVAMGTESRQ